MKKLAASLAVSLAILAAVALPHFAAAQDAYPNRTIKLVVPFAAGGNTDVVGRVTAAYMQKVLNFSVVVENRAGAGGITGADVVAKSAPDGYTLCVCGVGSITVAPAIEKLPYDPLKDLVPISLINTNPLILIVNPKLPATTAAELVALSKKEPAGLSYGTSGAGGLMHFAAEIFRVKNGANLTTVPYRGGALATGAVTTGEVHMAFANMSDAMGQLGANSVRGLAITTAQRSPHTPNIPTLVELRLLDTPIESWNALFAPAGTPQPIVDRLAQVMAQMAKDPEVQKRMADFGSIAVANSPQEFAKMLREETDQWAKSLKEIGLKK
jgi:tripartite-type tricarboxylate transporter receptor subunit TctC